MSKSKFNRDYDFNKFQVLAGILSESNLYDQGEFIPPTPSSRQSLNESFESNAEEFYQIKIRTASGVSFTKDREMILEYFKSNMNFGDTRLGSLHEAVAGRTSQFDVITVPKKGSLTLEEGSKLSEDIRIGLTSIGVHPNAYLITLEEY